MGDNILLIGVAEAKMAICKPKTLKDALQMSMKAMKQFWLSVDDDLRFRAAIGGVLNYYGEGTPEFEQLKWEVEQIKKISALLCAAQADLEVKVPEIDDTRKPIGIVKLWNELN